MLLDLVVSITVNLSEQKLYATRESGEQLVYVVSTGAPTTPTPVMSTEIERKYEVATLLGPGYAIPDVPWIMCPVDNPEHCIHPNMSDTPVGEPASLGCVRMEEEDAEELFSLVEEGTPFTVIDGVYGQEDLPGPEGVEQSERHQETEAEQGTPG